jgi:hypothetical protein
MLADSVQYGSTTAIALSSASSNCGPYGWFSVGAACAENSALMPIAGFTRFENIVDCVCALASAGVNASAASRHVRAQSLMGRGPPVCRVSRGRASRRRPHAGKRPRGRTRAGHVIETKRREARLGAARGSPGS